MAPTKSSNRITDRLLVVFDLETTGLCTENDRVVQFGTAHFRNGSLVGIKDTLVNPCMPIPAEASVVHSILDEDVADCANFGILGFEFASTLLGKTTELYTPIDGAEVPVLCGYNALSYDVPLLNSELSRHCIPTLVDEKRVLDPLVWLKFYKRNLRSRTLTNIAEYYNCPFANAHRASSDAEITGHILFKMIEDGTIPDDVDQALAIQKRLDVAIKGEQQRYGRFLYVDREDESVLRLGFGKHAGKRLNEAPQPYIRWLLSLSDIPQMAASEMRAWVG